MAYNTGSFAISGKPGGGKTYYSVSLILEELLTTDRYVITNIALNINELNAYVEKNYKPDANPLGANGPDVLNRLQVLEEDDIPTFWAHRGEGIIELPSDRKKSFKEGWKPNFTNPQTGKLYGGVAYFIDEIHNYINSRSWMDVGHDMLFYMSQHRKMGDSIYWITQSINNVDKQFRSITQEYVYVRNFSKEKFNKFIRSFDGFERQTYLEPYTGNQRSTDTVSFKLDTDIAACYDTSGGVGIKGEGGADAGFKSKGISIKWIFVGLIVIAVIVAYAITGGSKKVMKSLSPITTPVNTKLEEKEVKTESKVSSKSISNSNEHVDYTSYKNITLSHGDTSLLPENVYRGVVIDPSRLFVHSEDVSLIKAFDIPGYNISLETVVLQVQTDTSKDWTISGMVNSLPELDTEYSFDFTNLGSSLSIFNGSASVLASALHTSGLAHVLTKSELLTRSGKNVTVSSGRELPIFSTTTTETSTTNSVEYKPVAFNLDLLPRVVSQNWCDIQINQRLSEVLDSVDVGDITAPSLSSSSITSNFRIYNGSSVILSGLTSEVSSETSQKLFGILPSGKKSSNIVIEYIVILSANWLPVSQNIPNMEKISTILEKNQYISKN
jgi:hypothetical protein